MDLRPPTALVRSVTAAVVTALFATVLLVAGARWWTPASIAGPVVEAGWTRRSRAAFIPSGFHGAELDAATGRSFSWSREYSRLEFPALRRSRAHRVTLSVRGVRPPHVPQAEVTIKVDDQVRLSVLLPNNASDLVFEIPRAGYLGALVTIETPQPYRPGGPDPRALGVLVDRVAITPVNGPFVPGARTLVLLAVAVACVAIGLYLCGLGRRLALAISAVFAVAAVWLLLRDGAFMGVFPVRLAWLSVYALVAAGIVGVIRRRWPAIAGVSEWNLAAGVLLAVSVIKLGVFAHPLANVGDGLFQVHRAQVVHGGQYFFTSVTPKPFFEFPYPVAMYVFALPFWSWFPTELDLLRLLRTIAVIADGVTGLMLYGALRRQWNSRVVALTCVALWPLSRAPFEALANANLTNLFGQSVFGAALAGIAWLAAASSVSRMAVASLWSLLVIAFLAHFGTMTVGVVLLTAVGLTLILGRRGSAHIRRVGIRVFGMMAAALLASWFVYYSHFTDVYRRSWAAIAARESDDGSKMVASAGVKFDRWWAGIGDDYGRPGVFVLVTAAIGVVLLVRQRAAGAGRVFLAWLLAWVALTVLGILTPVTLRANLAAAPAFVAFSAIAIGTLASRGGFFKLAAVAAASIVAWDGWQIAVRMLRLD